MAESGRPLRVCFLGHSAALSGAEIALKRLLPALGVEAVVVLGEDGPLVGALRERGVDVRVVALPGRIGAYRRDSGLWAVLHDLLRFAVYLVRLRRVVASVEPDLVHTNSMKAHVYGGVVGRTLGLPVVWHVRDRLAADYLGSRQAWMMRALARLLPDCVVSPGVETAVSVGRRDVVVAPDGQTISEEQRAPAAVRETVMRVGIVGRIAEWKGQHVVLEGLARSALHGVELRIIGSAMFGESAYEQLLHIRASELFQPGQVDFRGFRSDVVSEMEALDVVIHASTIAEPFGQVVIEAMAVGVPVVATNGGGPAEVISSGVDGLLIAPGDPDALATALDGLVAVERRRQLRDAALVTAARYTPARTAAVVRAVYDQLILEPAAARPDHPAASAAR